MFKRLFCWAYFRGSLFSEGLVIGRNLSFQKWLDLTIKTASTNGPWVYIQEGLLSEGYLRLRFAGLIFGRANFFILLFFFFLGGGAYYRNFTVLSHHSSSEKLRTMVRAYCDESARLNQCGSGSRE